MRKRVPDKGLFAIPYAVICVIFVVFPLLLVVAYAFRSPDGGFSFSTFAAVFTNPSNYIYFV